MSDYRIETKCVQGGYTPGNGEPRQIPIVQSTTFKYATSEDMGKLFDLEASGYFYTRLQNPTNDHVAAKICALEGGTAAMLTSSGQAASFFAIFNIVSCGEHVVCSSSIYGGTFNLFAVTMKRMGIECIFIDEDDDEETLQKAFKPNTKAVFAETLANPALSVCDIEKLARVAHKNGVPLIIDNTFPTPIFCRPIEWGADIVVHSTTKYIDGHAIQVGGAIIDSGNFDWGNGNYPSLTEPDESYHGLRYTESFGRAAYITKARVQLTRDLGVYPPAQAAFYTDLGLQTLPVRMQRHAENAMRVAEFLNAHPSVHYVNYPGLKTDRYYELAMKYLPKGQSGVMSFSIKGGREGAVRFMDRLQLANNVVHVADVRTCVLHPASATHRQLTSEQLAAAGEVELAHHVVEDEHGRFAREAAEDLHFGQLEGERGGAHLPLGTVDARLLPADEDLQIVAVRAGRGEAQADVPLVIF